ncbi:hypothetical protein [Janthinobacterium sp. SUN033]|uniref:hypothetical protein n=1 Tax=Janthinobacterium sp. SUN033 TaxID=3002439 RepID=UPI0025B27339|nr:hypothetical protein [Janthinobacterium sp. SUN033]MDN2678463.1 hypothetical protein [Janthinobacterium sp. SUN033]
MQETLSRWLASSAGDVRFVEHPLRNTATVALSHATLVRFLAQTGHVRRIMSVPAAP